MLCRRSRCAPPTERTERSSKVRHYKGFQIGPSGPGETGLIPSIYRGKGVRKGRVSIVRVKIPPGVEERQEDSAGFCTGEAGFCFPPLELIGALRSLFVLITDDGF